MVQVLLVAMPRTRWPELDGILGFAIGLIPVGVMVWTLCSLPVNSRVLFAVLAAGLAVGMVASWRGWFALAAPFQVTAAAALGTILARQVLSAWWLALFACAALVADAWSVFAGPTRQVVERAPQILDYLLVHFAPLGGPAAGMGLGMSDLVFLSLFTAGSMRLGLKAREGFAAMLGSLVLTVVLAVTWKPALPALPLLSLAFLVVNASSWAALVRRGPPSESVSG